MISILINKISFDELSQLHAVTRIADNTATFFLSPLRYLLNGKSVQCICLVGWANSDHALPVFHDSTFVYLNLPEKKTMFRTIISVILAAPCTIIGTIIKTPTLFCSSLLKRRYASFNSDLHGMSSELKNLCDFAITMSRRWVQKKPKLFNFNPLNEINSSNNDELFQSCTTLVKNLHDKQNHQEGTLGRYLGKVLSYTSSLMVEENNTPLNNLTTYLLNPLSCAAANDIPKNLANAISAVSKKYEEITFVYSQLKNRKNRIH